RLQGLRSRAPQPVLRWPPTAPGRVENNAPERRTTAITSAPQNGTYGTGELGGTVVETPHRLRFEAL
ncbi:MAG: hypothetical protein ACYCV7_15600, partial [Acidimicrobiales bacterium]